MPSLRCRSCNAVLSQYNADPERLCVPCREREDEAHDAAVEAKDAALRAKGYLWCDRCGKLRQTTGYGRCKYCKAVLVSLEVTG